MARGGARPGSGRKKGVSDRPKLIDYWDEEAVAEYFEFLRDNYKEDARLMVFVGEQLMGKASQAITGPDGGPIQIKGVKITVRD